MKLYNNEISRRIVESSCIRPFVNESGVLCRCGTCYACKQKNNLDWSFRFECESNSDYVACKLGCTLTYDNLHLPILNIDDNKLYSLNEVDGYDLSSLSSNYVPVLCIEHYQSFINKLRERIKYRFENLFIRYFVSCEYGGANYRPHYHFAIWVCIIDKTQPVYMVRRDKKKRVLDRQLINPCDYEAIIQKGYIENWILGSERYLSHDVTETDNHPLNPCRCWHRVPDLWPYAESRLKYDTKSQSLKWKCVSIEVLGDSWGAYLGGYLAKEDLKKLAPGSSFVPEQKHCSQSTKLRFNDNEFSFGCIGFQWCEQNKDFYMNSLTDCQINRRYCFLSRIYVDKKGKTHTVSIPRSFRRYYYKIYSGLTELDWNRLTKCMRFYIEKGEFPSFLEEKRIDRKQANVRYIPLAGNGYMVDKTVTIPTFYHGESKYLYNKRIPFFPFAQDYLKRLYRYMFYKYTHCVRYTQSFYYALESIELFKPLSDKLEFVADYYPNCGFMSFSPSEFASTLADDYSQKLANYSSLVKRVLNKSSAKFDERMKYVRNRINTDLLNLKNRLYSSTRLSILEDKFSPVGLAINYFKTKNHDKKEFLNNLVKEYEARFDRPCPQFCCPF